GNPLMSASAFSLLGFRGTIGRTPYFLIGVTLLALKVALDWGIVTQVFHKPWDLETNNYLFLHSPVFALLDRDLPERQLYLTLLAVALPFIWVGLALTVRRLRDAGLPLWLVLLFFVPFVNLVVFLILS